MNNLLLFLFVFCAAATAQGQFTDDFSYGDFSGNPPWLGQADRFSVDNGWLRLTAPAEASQAYLSVPSESFYDAQWEFDLRMDFNPSSSNFTRVYLASDRQDLSGALNGYFVEIGGTPDEVSLYRQTGTSDERIIYAPGKVNANSVLIRVKVTRTATGVWELYTDVGIAGTYNLEGSAEDPVHTTSTYFGVYCRYTQTRSTLFYFDNFAVSGSAYIDLIPPTLDSVNATSSSDLVLYFSEPLGAESVTNVNNYSVAGIGSPLNVTLISDSTVRLVFGRDFINGKLSELVANGIRDQAGNLMQPVNIPFRYFHYTPPKLFNVIINELFPDPDPSVNLPNAEYIELYNRSNVPFNLKNWALHDERGRGLFPEHFLLPGDYLIVTNPANAVLFSGYGTVLGVPGFPTLNNATDSLTLTDDKEQIIDRFRYSEKWYRDAEKMEGGWSLERIDPSNDCLTEEENWTASEDLTGGTPGEQNSVFAIRIDATPPGLLEAIPLSDTVVLVKFDEPMNEILPEVSDVQFLPDENVVGISFADYRRTALLVEVNRLKPSTDYKLTIANVRDCSGNTISAVHISLVMSERALPGDVVINEVLFNPRPLGTDFIELYNNSGKYINMRGWRITRVRDGAVDEGNNHIGIDHLLRPGEFVVLTADKSALLNDYVYAPERNILEASLPSLPDSEGEFAVFNSEGDLIDQFFYTEKMHAPFIRDPEGVSLERIDPAMPTSDPNNWRSARTHNGSATPGLVNSNDREVPIQSGEFEVEPEIFRPGLGAPPYTIISYQFSSGGYVANVLVCDHEGRVIKTVAENEVLGASGFFRWDGDTDAGGLARMGYYVVRGEFFDVQGNMKCFYKRVVVAAEF